MTLHTLNKSPGESNALQDCLTGLSSGDTLILIENGVYGALSGYSKLFSSLPDAVELYVLSADLDARGLSDLNPRFKTANYDSFVALSCSQDKVASWF